MKKRFILLSIPLACSAYGEAGKHGREVNSSGEKVLPPLNWLEVARGIDAERTQTLRRWDAKYSADRNEPVRPFEALHSLTTPRKLDLSGVDACLAEGNERQLSFAQVLDRNLDTAMQARRIATNSTIDSPSAYNLTSDRVEVGWLSHPFCTFSPSNILGELRHSLDSLVVPDTKLAIELNNYLLQSNYLRQKLLDAKNSYVQAADATSKSKAEARLMQDFSEYKTYQGILMSCLGYTESLGGAESAQGDKIFENLNKKNYVAKSTRPEGVSMGMDRPADFFVGNRSRREQMSYGLPESMATYHDAMGRSQPRYFKNTDALNANLEAAKTEAQKQSLKQNFVKAQIQAVEAARASGMSEDDIHKKFFSNISSAYWVSAGVYQFKFGNLDTSKGDVLDSNIGPCVDQWNALYGDRCHIDNTVASYASALSSPGQAFNMFCGTQKLLQSFNVQVHTQNPAMTAEQNLNPDGTLKAPKDRCVHPFWKGGRGYNHFGPLANSAPRGSISSLPSFPGNLSILNECIHNNGRRVFSSR